MERRLYFYEHVDRSVDDIVAALTEPGSGVFDTATRSAVAGVEELRGRLHVDVGGFEVGREVTVELGAPQTESYAVIIPIHWRATRGAALFPSMTAHLEIAEIDDHLPLSQVSIIGAYHPPAGVAGALGDRLLGHRLAEAAVRHFVTELKSRLAPVPSRR